ncbi:MAG TPA: hypothetical protein VND15_01290 [Candidatus Acidoferrales bacterium]|nr:hypothetical protein [Candidatus Acidoferrales bacterium]
MPETDTITVRVPKRVRFEMRKRHNVNWSKDIRNFIESRLKAAEFLDTLKKIETRAKNRKVAFDSTVLVRAARDSR